MTATGEPESTALRAGDPLTPRELAAWRGLLRVHAEVTRELDVQLRAEHGLSVSSYEVLLFLGQAEDRRLRMADIADRVLLSRSGLTRLCDRLVELGYVTRSSAEGDGRGLYATLTPVGAEKLEAAGRSHRAAVRALFLDRLPGADQDALARIWSGLLDV